MMFRDQVGVLAGWFKGWNECEQTVALLSLLKRVSRTQARFLQLCLEHSLADCTELHVLEREANNPGQYRGSPSPSQHEQNESRWYWAVQVHPAFLVNVWSFLSLSVAFTFKSDVCSWLVYFEPTYT